MLAVYSAMDALPRSSSFNAINGGSNLIRHPSAEDLDAAHQLVSSARGERPNSHSRPEGHQSVDDLYHKQPSPAAVTDPASESAEGQSPSASTIVTDVTDSLGGQVCK